MVGNFFRNYADGATEIRCFNARGSGLGTITPCKNIDIVDPQVQPCLVMGMMIGPETRFLRR
jgi:hypothetical protein